MATSVAAGIGWQPRSIARSGPMPSISAAVGKSGQRVGPLVLDANEFVLTAENSEDLKAQATVFMAAAAGQPRWRAETLARAIALETTATQATTTSGLLERGNGDDVVMRVPLDAPWNTQEISRATSDAPTSLMRRRPLPD
jgi:hypothetical protein